MGEVYAARDTRLDRRAPGPDPSIYAFTKRDMQRNLYRIPLH